MSAIPRIQGPLSLPVLALLFGVLSAQTAHAAVILLLNTTNDTEALVEVGGTRVDFEHNTLTNTPSNSSAFHGDLAAPSEARTAGRSSGIEIAANARFDNRTFSPVTDYTRVRGTADHRLEAQLIGGGPAEVFIDFVLPPGFVEFTSNAELSPGIVTLEARVLAQLGLCDTPGCLIPDQLFHVDTVLTGDYYSHDLHNTASGAGLDLTPLMDPNVVVTEEQGGFIHRKTWSYPEFRGRLSLGIVSPDEIFEVAYFMDAIIGMTGFGPLTFAAAAINDPFFLSTDPVRSIELSLSAVDVTSAVPEPSIVWLMATGLMLSGMWKARRQGPRQSPHLRSWVCGPRRFDERPSGVRW